MPELSVVIPTYGRAEPLERAVASALRQDVDLEVIVIDDASPTPIALSQDGARVVRLDANAGPAAARNAGVAAASADWIAFLDSDDVWLPETLRPRLDAARAGGDWARTIWAAGFADLWPDGRRAVRHPKPSMNSKAFASGCWMCPGSTALFHREAWLRIGEQDPHLRRLEDYDWLLLWAEAGGRLAVHDGTAAEITRGKRASPEAVAAAASYLRSKHASLPSDLKRRMESYLALELCAARLHAGDAVGGAGALLRSWLLHPRLHTPLERHWTPAA